MSTVSIASIAVSLWTFMKQISKTRFPFCQQCQQHQQHKTELKEIDISEFFNVNIVNVVNSSKSLKIFEAFYKNKFCVLSTASTVSTAVSLWTYLKHNSTTRYLCCQQCQRHQQQKTRLKDKIFLNFVMSSVSTVSTAVSLWTSLRHFSKTRFLCCQHCQQQQKTRGKMWFFWIMWCQQCQ